MILEMLGFQIFQRWEGSFLFFSRCDYEHFQSIPICSKNQNFGTPIKITANGAILSATVVVMVSLKPEDNVSAWALALCSAMAPTDS